MSANILYLYCSQIRLNTDIHLSSHFLSLFLSFSSQLEYTARLDFLWRVQAKEEINEMRELREHNENMLRNILPSHVARHFLEKDRDNEVFTHTHTLTHRAVKNVFIAVENKWQTEKLYLNIDPLPYIIYDVNHTSETHLYLPHNELLPKTIDFLGLDHLVLGIFLGLLLLCFDLWCFFTNFFSNWVVVN